MIIKLDYENNIEISKNEIGIEINDTSLIDIEYVLNEFIDNNDVQISYLNFNTNNNTVEILNDYYISDNQAIIINDNTYKFNDKDLTEVIYNFIDAILENDMYFKNEYINSIYITVYNP